jgi:hypothetical protein
MSHPIYNVFIRQDYQDTQHFMFLDHFPDESAPTQSAWRRKKQSIIAGLYFQADILLQFCFTNVGIIITNFVQRL